MKKTYIKPVIKEVEFDSAILMNVASNGIHKEETSDEKVGNETPDLANQRRGTWGSLWE